MKFKLCSLILAKDLKVKDRLENTGATNLWYVPKAN